MMRVIQKRRFSTFSGGLLMALMMFALVMTWLPAGAPAASAPGGAVFLAMGSFEDVDGFHKGEGKAVLIRLAGGRRFLRLESFKVTNGPDLFVYLSGHPAPRTRSQLHEGAAFEVGRLKGNVGNQNYELPANLNLTQFKSVAIYCKRFSTMFSTATLSFPR